MVRSADDDMEISGLVGTCRCCGGDVPEAIVNHFTPSLQESALSDQASSDADLSDFDEEEWVICGEYKGGPVLPSSLPQFSECRELTSCPPPPSSAVSPPAVNVADDPQDESQYDVVVAAAPAPAVILPSATTPPTTNPAAADLAAELFSTVSPRESDSWFPC